MVESEVTFDNGIARGGPDVPACTENRVWGNIASQEEKIAKLQVGQIWLRRGSVMPSSSTHGGCWSTRPELGRDGCASGESQQ